MFSYATLMAEGIVQERRRRSRKEAKQVTFESEVYDQILGRSMHARNLKLNMFPPLLLPTTHYEITRRGK